MTSESSTSSGRTVKARPSMRVPGEPDFFLIKAHELLYDEVTASNLVKVDSRNDDVT